MEPTTTALRLHLGYPTPYTLGLATTTPSQPQPEVLDLLADGLKVRESGGSSDWIPTIAGTKTGQWADSETANGRIPVSLPTANAIESLSLVASSVQAGRDLLSKLNRFAEIGRAFWAETAQRPLYLEWASSSGAGSQFALVYNMQAAIEQLDPLEDAEEPLVVSLSIEREAAWRAIAPGLPAKYWTLISRGLKPTAANPAPAGFFNFDDLDLNSGVGDKAPLYAMVSTNGDELGTSNRNFIDIAAEDIPGDAPALITIVHQFADSALNVFLAKDVQVDYGSANVFGSAGSYPADTRRRMKFNAGDWLESSPTNVTTTKPITALGWLGNGSITDRYSVRSVFAAGSAGTTTPIATFTHPAQAYRGGNYGFFVTANSSVADVITLRATIAFGGGAEQTIGSAIAPSIGLSGRTVYLGLVSFPSNRISGYQGYPSTGTFTIRLYVAKPGATTPTLNVYDVWLMPYSDGSIGIRPLALDNPRVVWDNTGYVSGLNDFAGVLTPIAAAPSAFSGPGFTLTPGIVNRIYSGIGTGYDETTYGMSLNIIPRWYGVRTV